MFLGVSLTDGLCGVPKGHKKLHMATYSVRKACFHIQEHTARPQTRRASASFWCIGKVWLGL